MAAEEVRNGSFVYRDALFAEVGEGKRHPRASALELKDLLLPKKNAIPSKVQVAHWYEAQLLHYGLPRVKDKNAAKVRLLGALTGGSLNVPSHVRELEADLRKQYLSAQRKAKNVARKTETAAPASTGKKRKAGEMEASQKSGSTTKMSFTVGDMTVNIDHATSSSSKTAAKRSTTTAKAATPRATAKKENVKASPSKAAKTSSKPAKPPATKERKKSASPTKEQEVPSARSTATIGNHARQKQTARRGRPFNYSAGRDTPVQTAPTPVDTDDDEPPPPYSEYDGYGENSQANDSDINYVVQISGEYTISTSPDDSAELLIRLSHQRDQLWRWFNIESKTGIIRLDNLDDIAGSVRKSFGWRSEDSETGQLRFGKGCDGWIEFNGGGGVRGAFHGLIGGRDVDFDGGLQDHYGHESEDEKEEAIGAWASQWHEFPERAYGRR
ncbi:hypothetical protein PMZ80_001368 [Knufia obscura]|uniref:Uncharacterized protein n=1 Tax=Knufia obscura TaxID=1635080 RepID=A0ABR0S2Y5_9EURO|nr:hypothetical protein PMZ80_001368 [Knufia obscura]